MKKKIISIVIAAVLAVSSAHVLAESGHQDATDNKLNYTAIGIGAASGGLILGPVGVLVGGVIGSFYNTAETDDVLHSPNQTMNLSATPESDELVVKTELDQPADLVLAYSGDAVLFVEEQSAELFQQEINRVKEIVTNNLSIIVHFKPGSVDLESLYSQQLATISNLLHEMPELALNLAGYSDRLGTASDNLQLSMERLQSVQDYFTTNGIDESRIHIHAYGEKKFLSTAGELDSYMFDRRVEVSFKKLSENKSNSLAVINDSVSQ